MVNNWTIFIHMNIIVTNATSFIFRCYCYTLCCAICSSSNTICNSWWRCITFYCYTTFVRITSFILNISCISFFWRSRYTMNNASTICSFYFIGSNTTFYISGSSIFISCWSKTYYSICRKNSLSIFSSVSFKNTGL